MVTSSLPEVPGRRHRALHRGDRARALAARGHAVDVVLPHHPTCGAARTSRVRFFPYRYAPREPWSRWGYAQSLEPT